MEPIDNQISISHSHSTEKIEELLKVEGVPDIQEPIETGPYGAMVLAGIAVILLFIGWLLFYFFLFMRRGYIG